MKDEDIIKIKLKLIDIELEKKKHVHKLLFSLVVALITFGVVYGNVYSIFNNSLIEVFQSIINFNEIVGIVAMLLFMICLPILAYFISGKFIDIFIIQSTNEIYDEKIEELKKLINELTEKTKFFGSSAFKKSRS